MPRNSTYQRNSLYQQPEIPNFMEAYGQGMKMRQQADYNALAPARQMAQEQELQLNAMKIGEAQHAIEQRPQLEKVAALNRIYKDFSGPMTMLMKEYGDRVRKADGDTAEADKWVAPVYNNLMEDYKQHPDVKALGITPKPTFNYYEAAKGMATVKEILQKYLPVMSEQGLVNYDPYRGTAALATDEEGNAFAPVKKTGRGGAGAGVNLAYRDAAGLQRLIKQGYGVDITLDQARNLDKKLPKGRGITMDKFVIEDYLNSIDAAKAGMGKPLDQATARQLLKQAGGDKNKARELAKQQGYTF